MMSVTLKNAMSQLDKNKLIIHYINTFSNILYYFLFRYLHT